MLNQVKRAIEPALSLQEVLKCWNDIACSLAENTRIRKNTDIKILRAHLKQVSAYGAMPVLLAEEQAKGAVILALKLAGMEKSQGNGTGGNRERNGGGGI
ncbi:hypothetical protein [Candidatus Kuenenia stuttgartiensis]|uniref:Uncharacterized protein n=1 Tax=Kuenenia stuttgartiensis TaxID=174633 RepID=A0A2C9CF85_KUEST|nr:hypothetical protein [Candidatus Kuenenia stuttgartiensis]SOH04233.1 hypothetical protein KSMBR1_1734 [Candidatus Kuenenia stuttgartiensis]